METGEDLNSFPYDATIDGAGHHYRITRNEDKYGVEQDGVVIAELAHGKQVSGGLLPRGVLESICCHIETHAAELMPRDDE